MLFVAQHNVRTVPSTRSASPTSLVVNLEPKEPSGRVATGLTQVAPSSGPETTPSRSRTGRMLSTLNKTDSEPEEFSTAIGSRFDGPPAPVRLPQPDVVATLTSKSGSPDLSNVRPRDKKEDEYCNKSGNTTNNKDPKEI